MYSDALTLFQNLLAILKRSAAIRHALEHFVKCVTKRGLSAENIDIASSSFLAAIPDVVSHAEG